jgi:biopolymer transport protein ExbB
MLYAISESLISIRDFMEAGGSVLWLIAFLVLLMWSLIFERIYYLSHGYTVFLDSLVSKWDSRNDKTSWKALQIRDKFIAEARASVNKNLTLIKTCIALAPLFGLLGTVTGMIEVFQVMAFSGGGDARAMAGGVSKATLPTMAGMVVSLSGIFAMIYISSVSERHSGILEEKIKRA